MSAAHEVHMSGDDRAEVVDAMQALAERRSGWVNVTPGDVEPSPPQSVWGRLNGRGPEVPRITWTAPSPSRSGTAPAQLGIEHPTGGKALERLAEVGHRLPAGWQRLQDHPMRGLVVVPAADAEHDAVLAWALTAVEHLTGRAPGGPWRAEIHGA